MSYHIRGLSPEPFAALFGLDDEALAERGAIRRLVTDKPGFPCRISLSDAEVGDTVLLVNHVSHDVANPYRASHAIFVSRAGRRAADYRGAIPSALDRRILSLRAFDSAGMMVDAALARPGEADPAIRGLFDLRDVAYIHAHNALRGCFAAKVERA